MGRSSKDKRDIYYRLAKEEGWRARSAYKLLQIDAQFDIFSGITRAVDLCAAPGSWSQVLAQVLSANSSDVRIVAVDLQSMSPIPGVHCLQGDITSEATADEIKKHLGDDKAELVACDGAPDVTGLHYLDEYLQSQLLLSALNIATCVLQPKGTFVAKMFRSSTHAVEFMFGRVSLFFDHVTVVKPRSSRSSSIESFILARGFRLPENYTPKVYDLMTFQYSANATETEKVIIPFVTCGDLDGYDSDTTYPLSENYVLCEPVQKPISPSYEEAIMQKKSKSFKPPPDKTIKPVAAETERYLRVEVEFRGGADKLVGGIQQTFIDIPCHAKPVNMADLLEHIKNKLIVERPELLIKDGDVRPGILVLIDDVDWELYDKTNYEIPENARISFISTLHGG